MRVLITGAAGNLGSKLTDHLQTADWCSAIIGIDPKPLVGRGQAARHRRRPARPARSAAGPTKSQRPMPSSISRRRTRPGLRLVGSGHEHGHDAEPAATASAIAPAASSSPHPTTSWAATRTRRCLPANCCTADTTAAPGTRFFDGMQYRTPTAYGSSKLMGERAVAARCRRRQGLVRPASMSASAGCSPAKIAPRPSA